MHFTVHVLNTYTPPTTTSVKYYKQTKILHGTLYQES